MIETIQSWGNAIYVIITCVIAIITLLSLLVNAIKKAKATLTQLKGKTNIIEIYTLINDWYAEAEKQFTNKIEKRNYVLTQIEIYCEKINVDFNKDYWSELIDETIAMTKQVNVTFLEAIEQVKKVTKK